MAEVKYNVKPTSFLVTVWQNSPHEGLHCQMAADAVSVLGSSLSPPRVLWNHLKNAAVIHSVVLGCKLVQVLRFWNADVELNKVPAELKQTYRA